MGDLIDFNEAKGVLQMDEAELQNLVTRGELRAFRSGGTMKFKRADVEGFKKERETEPTIIIPAEQTAASIDAPPTEALQIDLPDDCGIDESAATVVPGGDAGTEEIVFDDSDLEILPVDDESASAVTSEITVQEAAVGAPSRMVEETVEIEEDDIEVEEDYDESPSGRRSASSRMSSVPSRRISAAYEAAPGSPAMTAVLIVTAATMIFLGSVFGVILWKGYGTDGGDGTYVKYVPNYLSGLYDAVKEIGTGK